MGALNRSAQSAPPVSHSGCASQGSSVARAVLPLGRCRSSTWRLVRSTMRDLALGPSRDYRAATKSVKDVARHLCTMSGDITLERTTGFEPATLTLAR